MGKNIVICCDGTGNEYGDKRTNVLELFSLLPKERDDQLGFYDPGVGTFSAPAALTRTARFVSKVFGFAFGAGIEQNIVDAYRFLMDHHEDGDRVFLFGFSRGAYTARAVAALVRKCGLLEPGNHNLLPYALKMFRRETRPEIYAGFRRTFSRRCPLHFLGLWDTVKSVGWIYDPLTLPFTRRNDLVAVVRHAMAIDERRTFYRQNLWGEPFEGQDVKQVWFVGAHSDVGGSYPARESGLSQIALRWMVDEAVRHGLVVDRERYARVVPDAETAAARRDDEPFHAVPDPMAELHRSLKSFWWIAEYLPKLYEDPRDDFRRKLMIPRGRPRFIAEGSVVHASVVERMERSRRLHDEDPRAPRPYDPPNLPSSYSVEP